MDAQAAARRRARRQLLSIGALCAAGVLALLWPTWRKLRLIEARSAAVDAEIAHLEQSIAALTVEHQKLTTDPTYVERVARQEFRTTRPGEILFKIEPSPTAGEPAQNTNRR